MALSDEEVTAMAKEAGARFRAWAAAVTDEDRAMLKERFGVCAETHDIMRASLVNGSTFRTEESTFVYVGDGQVISFSPRP